MDFSSSGIADLPATTAESLEKGDPRVLSWLREWTQEGDLINRSDPSYENIERAYQYVVGEQLSTEQRRLRYLPQIVINETRKAMQAHVSAITDFKPVVGWKGPPETALQADLLNKYLLAEWVTLMLDIDLGDVVKYALAGGTGDLGLDWDPHLPLGGGHQFSARDPRDTLPLRPSYGRSIQSWEGLCLREEHTVNVLRGMYPTKANLFKPSSDTALGKIMGRFRTGLSRLLSPADPLDQIASGTATSARRTRRGSLVLYRGYFHDRTRNLTGKAFTLGTPGSNWAYVVAPDAPLYPRGRLVVATDDAILYDGPNTYWHGLFPCCRLKLWSVPWQFLGVPLFNDLLPIQDAINDTVHDARLGIRQWVDPDITYNRNAVSESTMKLMDPRRPGKRVKVMPGFGEPWRKEDGPNAQVLSMCLDLWDKLTTAFTDKAGTANLTALLQLRQVPSGDTVEKYLDALTPEIRYEARMVESFLSDLAQQMKVNYFQFLSKAKRVQILGAAGEALVDLDWDPNTLVPATKLGDANYKPELDPDRTTRDERAAFIHNSLQFIVAPNSVLALEATEKTMMYFQLARMGYLDAVTLAERLEIPNYGTFPPAPLPPLDALPQGVMEGLIGQIAQNPMSLALVGAGGAPPQFTDPATGRTFTLDIMSGQIMELRVPITVMERLQVQQMMGLGQTTSPAGRKASGQEPPKQTEKSDGQGGQRQTITESRH